MVVKVMMGARLSVNERPMPAALSVPTKPGAEIVLNSAVAVVVDGTMTCKLMVLLE